MFQCDLEHNGVAPGLLVEFVSHALWPPNRPELGWSWQCSMSRADCQPKVDGKRGV